MLFKDLNIIYENSWEKFLWFRLLLDWFFLWIFIFEGYIYILLFIMGVVCVWYIFIDVNDNEDLVRSIDGLM